MSKPLFVSALLVFAGCAPEADDAVPVVSLDVSASCGDPDTCISAGAKAATVEGVRLVHRRLAGAPTVSMRVLFDHPNRGPQQLWAEYFALRLLASNGPRAYEDKDWRAALGALGARFEVDDGLDYSEVIITAPAPRWSDAAELLTAAVTDPSTAGLDWNIASTKSSYDISLDDADDAASIHAWSALYEGHRYERARSSLATLDQIDEALVERAWAALRTTARMSIVVVGDVSWDDAVSALHTLAWSARGGEPEFELPPADAAAPTADHAAIYDYPEAPAWHVIARFRGPDISDPALPALAVGLAVLDRRLWNEVRERRGLSYTVGAGLTRMRESSGVLWFSTSEAVQTLPVVHDTLAALLADGPTADELAAAIESRRSSYLTYITTPDEIAAFLGAGDVRSDDVADIDHYLGALAKVTAKQAHDALKAYLRNMQIVAAGAGEPLDEATLLQALPGHEPPQS